MSKLYQLFSTKKNTKRKYLLKDINYSYYLLTDIFNINSIIFLVVCLHFKHTVFILKLFKIAYISSLLPQLTV